MDADYVIVGSGSAGAAVAYRLCEAGHSVAMVEWGGGDRSPLIRMPAALSYPMNTKRYDWGFMSEPEANMGGRRMAVPRGKVLGGSSSINGMVYVRGHPLDFDRWQEMGAAGWGFADVLPYFRRMEAWDPCGHGGDPDWRGRDGPLHVTRGALDRPLFRAFIEAGRQAGYGVTDDYNGHRQEGFGPMERTILRGERWSVVRAYLDPARKTGRLRIVRALAGRVIFDGRRATGVEIAAPDAGRILAARREVILAASAINSPKLLMLSGIGPAEALRLHGIDVLADRPGVGQNLQDHLEVYVQFAARHGDTLYRYWSLAGKTYVGARWLLSRGGPGGTNHLECTGFIRSRAGVRYPDLQFHFLPLAVRYDGTLPHDGHGFQVHVGPMRSPSRGSIALRSADPLARPVIRFNYLSHPEDWRDFRQAIRLTREILAQPAMAAHVAHELRPGPEAVSDADLDGFVRDHAESAYHPCGTCRMGAADDARAVVDPETRVIGVAGLRVVDTSIFPQITNGNINAPAIMAGEKAADHILGRTPLARDNAAPWVHPEWERLQR